jgi:hypothetical protein
MMLNYKIIKENGKDVVYINDGYIPGIYQPHDPELSPDTPWESYEAAELWAQEKITQLNAMHGVEGEKGPE